MNPSTPCRAATRALARIVLPALFVLGPAAAAPCLAQQSSGQAPIDPPAEAGAVERAAAERALQRHAERQRGVRVLTANYVQRRTTELIAEPLTSRGAFLFVREPACVVFRAEQPRPSVVRLTRELYEVHRPHKQQLERFRLADAHLADGLFAAVGGDAERLLRDFAVASCRVRTTEAAGGDGGDERVGRLCVRLVPKAEAARSRLRELILTFRDEGAELCAVAYRDHSGDLVEIRLEDLQRDPERPPPATLDVPDGTRIIEHAPPPQHGAADDGRAPAK